MRALGATHHGSHIPGPFRRGTSYFNDVFEALRGSIELRGAFLLLLCRKGGCDQGGNT